MLDLVMMSGEGSSRNARTCAVRPRPRRAAPYHPQLLVGQDPQIAARHRLHPAMGAVLGQGVVARAQKREMIRRQPVQERDLFLDIGSGAAGAGAAGR